MLNSLPDLQARIEELQEEIRCLRISYLRLANAVAPLMPDRAKFFADLTVDSYD
jgi:hypothetical protein